MVPSNNFLIDYFVLLIFMFIFTIKENICMMKRILFLLLMFLADSASWAQAQEVFSRPIAEDHKTWRHENMQIPGNSTRLTYTDGDTIISNQHYYKYYTCNTFKSTKGCYEGAIYDKGRKTYTIKEGETEPQLLYNFDVVEGDVFTISGEELRVEKDTIMELNNELYRYLKLYNITRSKEANEATTIWWIEGIGALSPYLSRSTYNDKRDPRELVACYVDQELVYYNESYTLDVPSLRQTVYADKSLYDLSGRRVGQDDKGLRACSPEHLRSARTHSQTSSLPKGIYIQNGRKFVVK